MQSGRTSILFAFFAVALVPGARNALHAADADGKADKPVAAVVSYPTDIKPLLDTKCVRCHDAKTHKSDLDLSTPSAILKGGESGPVLVSGKPDESTLYKKVHDGTMPPGKKDPLSETEVDSVRRWIAGGAKWNTDDNQPTLEAAVSQHDVYPILLRRCTACHGLLRKEGNLDLRSKASLLRGGKSGPAMIPGKPEESLIVKKVRAEQMPPRDRLVEASVKLIEPGEIEVLVRWIAAGAPESALEPDVATTTPDPLVSDKDRDFWAFRAPRPVSIPAVKHSANVRNPIDAFVLQKLESKGLSFSPEADRTALMRRAFIDLTGLPPTPEEIQAYLQDDSPNAYEKMIDRLLASPRYGERWGRFWLDLAGYADSEGKREQDLPRPHAWRYRDYVIRSFNTNKPYDRFLLEQIAGDELADYENAKEITPEIYDNLVATGFLRMAPDGTWANITGFVPDRLDVIADEIDVLGSTVLGLTMKCARCHSHKFDPIPHRDYYRLLDVFKGAYDEFNWLKPDVRPGLGPVSEDPLGGRLLPYVTTAERSSWEAQNAKIRAQKGSLLPEPRIQALWDRGEPSPTYIYRRGDSQNPGRLVGPGVPSVLTDGKTPFEVKPPWPGAKKTGRRLALARWLVQPDHPLTARVAVNRLWKQHFGSGIVKTLDNFGKAGAPPTHPELLDWLAREFVRGGWDVKAMHRLLMTSNVYRQSSVVTPDSARADPDNAWLSRMPLTRLDAESLYDTLLFVAGRLDEKPFGPADAVRVRPDGLVTPTGRRRLIYVQQTRKQLATHLETFDYPQMNPNCIARRDSTVATQALHLMNNGTINQLAEDFARRVCKEAGSDESKQIQRIHVIAFARPASEQEEKIGLESLSALTTQWSQHLAKTGKPDPEAAKIKALTTYCHALMNSAGFLYVD